MSKSRAPRELHPDLQGHVETLSPSPMSIVFHILILCVHVTHVFFIIAYLPLCSEL